MWAQLKAWCCHSLTIAVARAQMLLGLLGASIFGLAQDPNITGAVQSILKPQYVPYYVIALGFVVELARRRTVDKPTNENNQIVEKG